MLSTILLTVVVLFPASEIDRVAKEEQALLASLGRPYAAYSARTKRFIPYLL